MFQKIRRFCLAIALTAFYWGYSRLWFFHRIRLPKLPEGQPHIYAHWHGDELLLIGAHIRGRMAIMASRSKDGDLLKWMLGWLGYYVVRGSSTRGGAGGLKGLIDAVSNKGWNASLAVDGPRGPVFQVKPGILKLAQQTGRPLIPGAAAASRRFVFKKAWNRCYLPFPFSRCVIVYGEPMRIPPGARDEEFEALRLELQNRLLNLKKEAEAQFQRELDPALLRTEPTGV